MCAIHDINNNNNHWKKAKIQRTCVLNAEYGQTDAPRARQDIIHGRGREISDLVLRGSLVSPSFIELGTNITGRWRPLFSN